PGLQRRPPGPGGELWRRGVRPGPAASAACPDSCVCPDNPAAGRARRRSASFRGGHPALPAAPCLHPHGGAGPPLPRGPGLPGAVVQSLLCSTGPGAPGSGEGPSDGPVRRCLRLHVRPVPRGPGPADVRQVLRPVLHPVRQRRPGLLGLCCEEPP
ncbi:Zn-dependent peptidase ImmA, M78 family, partial [Dysosmobacter welbionis]